MWKSNLGDQSNKLVRKLLVSMLSELDTEEVGGALVLGRFGEMECVGSSNEAEAASNLNLRVRQEQSLSDGYIWHGTTFDVLC